MYFLKKIIFHFLSRKNIIYSRKRGAIFPDGTGKIMFQCNFFGKAIFSEIWRKYQFPCIFLRTIIFHFPSKEKDHIFGENIIIPNDTRNIIFQCDFFWKDHLFRTFGNRKYRFSCSAPCLKMNLTGPNFEVFLFEVMLGIFGYFIKTSNNNQKVTY